MANPVKIAIGTVKVVSGSIGLLLGVEEGYELIKEGIKHISEGACEN